ncbi:uncharacterized protein N7511_010427 [Penicillium nucicola]|uniref:uncharacterized protein n=1 Tax=Penicillium nucicola TaxID=1850975 RepID=UPI002544E0CD|nr:uncharacterized protein N7511_010427 [Penicillium nucicola]KAJ5748731.1 hypothetical protein N7511_010427 [Penicillium nucicola]
MTQPNTGLNVIALISGGKDSFYSILHCIRNGHKVVALANLYPEPSPSTKANNDNGTKEDEDEDIDSFMYQTIGHSIIPLYEEALGIPLYRQVIKGNAIDTSRIYKNTTTTNTAPAQSEETDIDETESLVPLLTRIKQAHPEANAVSAGAILSTYQRTRIENIAGRLGLTPLAWLWQYPILPAPDARRVDPLAVAQAGLLEDMAAVGCNARIIKVASGGLDEGFLWEDVSGDGIEGRRVRGRIGKAMGRFAGGEDVRGAVLGEGGEYETLALDGPDFLWRRRIGVERVEVKTGEGGVAFVKVVGARCEVKERGDGVVPGDVRRPALLDDAFRNALEGERRTEGGSVGDSVVGPSVFSPSPEWTAREPVHRQTGLSWTFSNIIAPEAGPGAEEQMKGIAVKVEQALKDFSHAESGPRSTDDIAFATVLLNSMADFGSMNNVYVSLFNKPNPPARVTVACGDRLPSNVKVMVSFVVDLGARDMRQGLHVQSRSYWAPANIGPYSQAMSVPLQNNNRLVHIAGQIPLDPASMDLAQQENTPFEDYRLRAVLALQHLWRIGEATQVDWWLGVVAFLARGEQADAQARVAWRLWEKMHALPSNEDEDDDEGPQLDAWDLKYGRRTEEVIPNATTLSIPKFTALNSESATSIPPFLAVQVDELPRGSDIEWQGLGGRCEQVKLGTARGPAYTTTMDGEFTYTSIEVEAGLSDDAWDDRLDSVIKTHCQNPSLSQAVLYTTYSLPEAWPGQVVPCRSVWGCGGRKLGAGVVLQQLQ